jgi:hypothetical protein
VVGPRGGPWCVDARAEDAMTASDKRGVSPCGSGDPAVVPRQLKGSNDSG